MLYIGKMEIIDVVLEYDVLLTKKKKILCCSETNTFLTYV